MLTCRDSLCMRAPIRRPWLPIGVFGDFFDFDSAHLNALNARERKEMIVSRCDFKEGVANGVFAMRQARAVKEMSSVTSTGCARLVARCESREPCQVSFATGGKCNEI